VRIEETVKIDERNTYPVGREDLDGLFNWQGIRRNTPRISTPNSANRTRHGEIDPTCPSSFVEELVAPLVWGWENGGNWRRRRHIIYLTRELYSATPHEL
jgi:hypothetical protein